MPPKPNEYYRLRSCPLIVLQMNVNVTATKKKRKDPKFMSSKGLVGRADSKQ